MSQRYNRGSQVEISEARSRVKQNADDARPGSSQPTRNAVLADDARPLSSPRAQQNAALADDAQREPRAQSPPPPPTTNGVASPNSVASPNVGASPRRRRGSARKLLQRMTTSFTVRRRSKKLSRPPEGVDWAELASHMPLEGESDAEAFALRLKAFHDDELTELTKNGRNSILSYAVARQDLRAVRAVVDRLRRNPRAQHEVATVKNDDDLSALDIARSKSSTQAAAIVQHLERAILQRDHAAPPRRDATDAVV